MVQRTVTHCMVFGSTKWLLLGTLVNPQPFVFASSPSQ